jgi:hypothetical protein
MGGSRDDICTGSASKRIPVCKGKKGALIEEPSVNRRILEHLKGVDEHEADPARRRAPHTAPTGVPR